VRPRVFNTDFTQIPIAADSAAAAFEPFRKVTLLLTFLMQEQSLDARLLDFIKSF
jgi:hypothetical protein